MKHKPFRKPRIRKFGDVRRLTLEMASGGGSGQATQGGTAYDIT